MSTLSRSWNLVKASWNVLQDDKELVVFPIVSAIALILVTIAFAVPGFFLYAAGGNEVLGYVLLFLFYLVQYTVITFANAALVGAAMMRLRGQNPTLGDGFQIAFSRFGAIVGYALIAATVGMILQAISERGTLGNIVRSILGTAWNLITYLVVPVLVVENVGPIEAVKRSALYLRRTWGEQVVGGAGMGLVFFILFSRHSARWRGRLCRHLAEFGRAHRRVRHRRRARVPCARAPQFDAWRHLLGGGVSLRGRGENKQAICAGIDSQRVPCQVVQWFDSAIVR